jgi:hypothetical protein
VRSSIETQYGLTNPKSPSASSITVYSWQIIDRGPARGVDLFLAAPFKSERDYVLRLTDHALMMNDYDLRPRPAERRLTATEKAIIINNMNLRDADSARFRWLPFDPSKSHYCGWVNAKNAYGGYTGFQPFEASIQTDDKGHNEFLSGMDNYA